MFDAPVERGKKIARGVHFWSTLLAQLVVLSVQCLLLILYWLLVVLPVWGILLNRFVTFA